MSTGPERSTAVSDTAPFVHRIESQARVWLRLNEAGTGWEIDHPTHDGYPLEGYDDGPLHNSCPCHELDETPEAEALTAEGDALRDRVDCGDHQVDGPTAPELLHLLADYLGYTLTPPEAPRPTSVDTGQE